VATNAERIGALVALGTLLLAIATVYLGRQTRDLARRSGEELELLRAQTTASQEQAAAGREQLGELREARFAEFLPILRWQSPQLGGNYEPGAFTPSVVIILRNEGPGPARLLRVSLDGGSDLYHQKSIDEPSTLPAGEPIRVEMQTLRPITTQSIHERPIRSLEIRLRYADVIGQYEYETMIRLELTLIAEDKGTEMGARFALADERSALERRLPTTSGRRAEP
jgi:hypothetical protein